ncbi:hypothetical protein RMATCC62417_04171 [Rhizopus microsporus]|nr:hypothetical protein RMATCC62417_04171 [Rhizopus microsporus]
MIVLKNLIPQEDLLKLKGFLRGFREKPLVSQYPTFYAVSSYSNLLATKAAKSIELYKEYKDVNIELEGFESQYNKILGIYKDVFNNDTFESISDYTYAKNNSAKLVRFSAELLKEAISKPELKIKTWRVMPRPSNNMLFVPLSGVHAMHGVLERCFNAGLKIPQQHIPVLMGPTSFENHYGDVVWKNNLWETLFNLDHIQKKRSNASQEQIAQDDSEMQFMKRRVNLTNWSKRLYPLKKEPTGITLNDRIIGLDPGFRDIFVSTDRSAAKIVDKKAVKENTTTMRSGFEWARKIELKNREAAGIQQVYSEIPVVDSVNSSELLKYLRAVGRNREKIFDFMKGYRHRETKACLVQNRQITDNHMCDLILGQTAAGAPYTLAHRTNSKKRKKSKEYIQKGKWNIKRTVIAYGDASLTGTKEGYTPIPVKKVQRALAQRALVIPVDEFRTSVACSKCHRCLENKYERQKLVCNHKKKKVCLQGEKNATLRCLDDNKRVVCRTSECPQREPSSYPPVIYQLKHCQLCPATNDRDIVWQRGINAALNICSILVTYVESNYSILSRHPSLKRESTSGGYQATSQPL